jgi:hypothetical protein
LTHPRSAPLALAAKRASRHLADGLHLPHQTLDGKLPSSLCAPTHSYTAAVAITPVGE